MAARHAKAFDGEVIIVTSLTGGEKTKNSHITETEKGLEKTQHFFDQQQLPCQTHLLVRGRTAGEDIVTFARDNGVEKIMIGVKSRSKVGKLIFGSTAQYVILKADCPVTTVK